MSSRPPRGNGPPSDPRDDVKKPKSKREIALDAVLERMRNGRVPRRAMENFMRAQGLTRTEVDETLVTLYDEAAALGLVKPRA